MCQIIIHYSPLDPCNQTKNWIQPSLNQTRDGFISSEKLGLGTQPNPFGPQTKHMLNLLSNYHKVISVKDIKKINIKLNIIKEN